MLHVLDRDAFLAPMLERALDIGGVQHTPASLDDLLDIERLVGGDQDKPYDIRQINGHRIPPIRSGTDASLPCSYDQGSSGAPGGPLTAFPANMARRPPDRPGGSDRSKRYGQGVGSRALEGTDGGGGTHMRFVRTMASTSGPKPTATPATKA